MGMIIGDKESDFDENLGGNNPVSAKQLRIQEVYGEYWACVKDYVDKNGWCNVRRKVKFEEIINKLGWETKLGNQYNWRPKSLQGIENNKSWIRIESEDDLPKEKGYYNCLYEDGEIIPHHFYPNSDFDKDLFIEEFTHYQPIVKPELPIY